MTTNSDFIELIKDYLDDATAHLDQVELALVEMEKGTGGDAQIQPYLIEILGSLHTLKGNSGMMGFSSLQTYIHKFESILKPISEDESLMSAAVLEELYRAVAVIRKYLHDLSENHGAHFNLDDEISALDQIKLESKSAINAGIKTLHDEGQAQRKSGTMKVDFVRLDELLNLVGELVIHRTTLHALEGRFREVVKDRALLESFSEATQLISKSAGELREAIMKVRMLPAKTVFQRFNRLVRDLSKTHGKEIHLIFEGEETELDKTVIDEIGEPLLHLVRNAVDHGIESPDERERAGKARNGRLKLRACHESNHIVITVEDDGRGLSVARIRETALQKGLYDAQTIAGVGEQELLQLVFQPGFSTSREVTETSGRGIGLDVVKKNISALGGTIEIDSHARLGTTFTIKLPLTLAIIQSLLVEIAGKTFAIPLSGVLESVKIDSAQIHQVAAGEMINLRDRLLPIVRLDKFFQLTREGERAMEYVVIVASGEKRGGIIVDRLIGQQEIVIKGIDDYLGELPGISGGTVLGDGKVSLIIDIGSLLAKTNQGGKRGR